MRFVGIDPGKNGGVALLDNGNAHAWKMPETEKDTQDLFEELALGDKVFCLIEEVHAMPGQGVVSMFSFGRNYGMLRAMLVANYIPFETVTPQTWQREYGLTNRQWSKTVKKNHHKARAQELFPHIKMTHALADALLIAEYGRRNSK
ncbi:MAG: hypothetical protein MK006_16450 [Pirellulales bacterium]|jgi:crossover junction endodeoxyribonuclease RuvC|nr:hypothetical protein [Pirellulales bacterium]|tara:strand:- start:98 stop:538 length:441 start_codon:yes stop_codon:yes gene_type:complete